MKPRTPKANVYEILARSRKVARLVLAVEEMAEANDNTWSPTTLATVMTKQQWTELAVVHGQHPPSEETIRDVLAMLVERARRSA